MQCVADLGTQSMHMMGLIMNSCNAKQIRDINYLQWPPGEYITPPRTSSTRASSVDPPKPSNNQCNSNEFI